MSNYCNPKDSRRSAGIGRERGIRQEQSNKIWSKHRNYPLRKESDNVMSNSYDPKDSRSAGTGRGSGIRGGQSNEIWSKDRNYPLRKESDNVQPSSHIWSKPRNYPLRKEPVNAMSNYYDPKDCRSAGTGRGSGIRGEPSNEIWSKDGKYPLRNQSDNVMSRYDAKDSKKSFEIEGEIRQETSNEIWSKPGNYLLRKKPVKAMSRYYDATDSKKSAEIEGEIRQETNNEIFSKHGNYPLKKESVNVMSRDYVGKDFKSDLKNSKRSAEIEKEIIWNHNKRNWLQHKHKWFKRNSEDNFDKDNDFDPFEGAAEVPEEVLKKYQRGEELDVSRAKSTPGKVILIQTQKQIQQSVQLAARSELLLQEEAGFLQPDDDEDTFTVEQEEIVAAADITSASKYFDLSLTDFGPYKINYSRDGRHLLLGGYLGHVAAMDWVTKRLHCEINVMQSVHDLCWLHVPTMFATAQKDWVYIYDNKGIELHCIKKLNKVLQLEFLPYHFLLVTASEKGFLSWLDISVGKMVKETFTSTGRLNIMCQNPYNAVVVTGHPNGSVRMWSPNLDKPLARILCYPRPVTSIAVDNTGLYMAVAFADRAMKIFDVRTFKSLQTYKLGGAAGFLDFSQQGLLGVGFGNVVEVYKDCCTQSVKAPYMRHQTTSTVSGGQFCPYEDVLGIGYSKGFNSILIPGAGQPNFDAYESNPYMTKKQRREMEVKSLLEKIQPDLITLNPGQLASVDVSKMEEKRQEKAMFHVNYKQPPKLNSDLPYKAKGRSQSAQVFKRKQITAEAAKRQFIKSAIQQKSIEKEQDVNDGHPLNVLDRFRSRNK